METRLSQTQTQRMILAPQMRQFLKLLELPALELEQKIQDELEQNPVLEESKPDREEELRPEADPENEPDPKEQVRDILQEMELLDRASNRHEFPQDFSQNEPDELQRKRDYQETVQTKPPTLAEYLTWQLGLLELTKTERQIAGEIIGNINDDGQLVATMGEIAHETDAPVDHVEKVLKKIQSLDPPGVGGRDLGEILLIQLRKKEEETSLAQAIIKDHLSLLERKHFDQLARLLKTSPDRIKEVYRQISKLEPKPGRIFYQERSIFVVPDATVAIPPDNEEELVIEMNQDFIAIPRINPLYREMIKRKDLDPETKAFLRDKIQAGLNLIRALAQRKSTLYQITEELVKVQRDFFTKGFAYLKPLRLKDISEKIGVHESTVSRAMQAKYLETPQGTIPYKSFFSNRLESTNGKLESQKSALERLKSLIANEDKRKPVSDAKLVKLLEQEGIKIARRTVAKYRELLKILPAYLRKTQ